MRSFCCWGSFLPSMPLLTLLLLLLSFTLGNASAQEKPSSMFTKPQTRGRRPLVWENKEHKHESWDSSFSLCNVTSPTVTKRASEKSGCSRLVVQKASLVALYINQIAAEGGCSEIIHNESKHNEIMRNRTMHNEIIHK